MDFQRIMRFLSGAMVSLGLIMAGLSIIVNSASYFIIAILTTLVGAGVYCLVESNRDKIVLWRETDINLSQKEAILAGLIQVLVVIVLFILISWLTVQFSSLANFNLDWSSLAMQVRVVSIGLGISLGGGVTYLNQRNEFVSQLYGSFSGQLGILSLIFGPFVIFLTSHAWAAVYYAASYLGSRVLVLLWLFIRPYL